MSFQTIGWSCWPDSATFFKGIGAFAFYMWTDTMLRRTLGSFLDYTRTAAAFAPIVLEDPRPFDAPRFVKQALEADRQRLLSQGMRLEGKVLSTTRGQVHQGDLVLFSCEPVAVGFALYVVSL